VQQRHERDRFFWQIIAVRHAIAAYFARVMTSATLKVQQ
jgi:hypothetical protein